MSNDTVSVGQPSNEVDEVLGITATQKLILVVAGMGILLGAGYYVEKTRRDAREEAVAVELNAAKKPEDKRAIALKQIGTKQAALVLLDLAAQEFSSGKPADAILTYETFLKHHSDHPLASSARLGLALSYEATSKLAEASDALRVVVADKNAGALAPQALLALSRIELQRGNGSAARQALQDLVAQHSQSVLVQDANERLKRLKN